MRWWLLRHGEAEPRAQSDAERALTAQGWRQAEAAGRWLAACTHPPQRIVASPYRRARETAEAVAGYLQLPVTVSQEPVPGAEARRVAAWLETQPGEFLLVSHQPLVSALVDYLTEVDVPMGTGSLAQLEGAWPGRGCLRLRVLKHAPELGGGPP